MRKRAALPDKFSQFAARPVRRVRITTLAITPRASNPAPSKKHVAPIKEIQKSRVAKSQICSHYIRPLGSNRKYERWKPKQYHREVPDEKSLNSLLEQLEMVVFPFCPQLHWDKSLNAS